MEQRFDRIDERLDRIVDLQGEMNVSLSEHIRRTELAEQNIDRIVADLRPVQQHVALVRGIGTLITIALAAGAAIATMWNTITGGQ